MSLKKRNNDTRGGISIIKATYLGAQKINKDKKGTPTSMRLLHTIILIKG